jgi:hypothetical protein
MLRSADRRRLLGAAMESSPSAHSFAKLMRWSTVLGLQRPNSSLKSRRMRPSRKASMALSGEIFSAVLRRLIHREMYDLRFSPVLCTHKRNSSNDVGRREVPRKLAINACRNSWEITHCFIFSTFSFIWVLEVITTVMTAPYLVYFVFVPREASNLSEVRFGDVAVLKQFSVLYHKNSWKFSVYLLDLRFLVHMPQVISKLSLVEHFFIWATENPSKILPLSAVQFWQISANICVCHFIAFFWFLLIMELLGKLLQ